MDVKYPLDIESSIEESSHFSFKAFILKNKEGNLFEADNDKYKIDDKFKKEIEEKT